MLCSDEATAAVYRAGLIFFFQAEDGIRDIGVTGVQTCALPISCAASPASASQGGDLFGHRAADARHGRSEERRVGKEFRSRWWRLHEKKLKATLETRNSNVVRG